VRVEGTPAAVRVTTSDGDTISNILLAFDQAFNIKYRATISLDARRASATYLGSFGK
jgi:small nuclear ribonucleoprotein (snRNP)-like protein